MGDDIWTVKRILEWIQGYLAQHGDENPRVSAQWLVAEALGMSRMQLFVEFERPLNPDERAVLREWTRRRAAGEPLQYITGTVGFRHITVKVRPGVLIPRPETELLVSEALALLPSAPKPQDALDAELLAQYAKLSAEAEDDGTGAAAPNAARCQYAAGDVPARSNAAEPAEAVAGEDVETRPGAQAPSPGPADELLVADLCTGTGCIACSIAHEHARAHVVATDIAPEAVQLARENVDALGLDERIRVLECDLGAGVDEALMGAFDLVVSNPPYVPTDVLSRIPREVADYEPALALDGGPDGLDVFHRLLAWCGRALKPGGAFAFELHETRLDDAAATARAAGFADVRIVRDLAERPRIIVGRAPSREG